MKLGPIMYEFSTPRRAILAILVAAGTTGLGWGCDLPNRSAPSVQEVQPTAPSDGVAASPAPVDDNGLTRIQAKDAPAPETRPAIATDAPQEAASQSREDVVQVAQDEIDEEHWPHVLRDIKTKPVIHPHRSAGGRKLAYWVFGDTGPVTLVLGGIHGNEYTPTVLSAEFIEWLETTPLAFSRGRIVVAPLVDPDGFHARRRGNDNDVDLNRNYPAKNWRLRAGRHGSEPLSESESRFVMELLEEFEPECIISVHGPLACVNYDGPAEELARRMSHACGLPVRASVGYATPGSFGSYAGIDLQIPTITLELRPGRTLDPDFDACRQALLAAHEFSIERSGAATATDR